MRRAAGTACPACSASLPMLRTGCTWLGLSQCTRICGPISAGVVAFNRAAAAAGGKASGHRSEGGTRSSRRGMPVDSAKDTYLRRLRQAQR